MILILKQANAIVEGAIARARAMGLKPLTVVVVDPAGHMVAMQREDGASMFRQDIAFGKAWAAAAMGANSRDLHALAADNPSFFNALSAASGGRFIPQTGGVVIRGEGGVILGAVGASGALGHEDEAACIAGIDAAGLRSDG